MNWHSLTSSADLEKIKQISETSPVLIFKHSTRCSVSSMAKRKLESEWDFPEEKVVPYYLDLLAYRPISDSIARDFSVTHQSPQILLIKNGKCVYNASHHHISAADIAV